MKQHFHITRLLLLPVAALLCAPRPAFAQTTIYPIPFITTIAGLAAGSGNTLCTSGYYPNIAGTNLGDGCAATQATLITLYDVQVDSAGNVYTSENGSDNDIRVVYRGGTALYNLLIAANPSIPNFTPVPGHIYTLAGGLSGSITTKSGSSFLCGNIAGGITALDSTGNGCPAAQAYIKPRGMAIDQYGNVFSTSNGSGSYVKVVYAGGSTVAKLITLENPTVTTPKLGYIYKIAGTSTAGYAGDNGLANGAEFEQLRYLAVDSNDNIYVSDATTGGGSTSASNNSVRKINSTTGIITTIIGETTCENNTVSPGTSAYNGACPAGNPGSNVPAAGALLNVPYAIFVDSANNLYIADYYNAVLRVIYMTAGSTIPGLGSNLTVGNLYTVAGGGPATITLPGTPATTVKFGTLYVAGIDHAGNLYAEDGTSKLIWRFDAKTALGEVIAGGGGTATSLPKNCSTVTTGETQTFLDNLGDGCPATQAPVSDTGTISFDPQGNFYLAESSNGVVRELSYNNSFTSVTTGSTASQYLAFEVPTVSGVPTAANSLMGSATTDYTSTVGSVCTTSGAQTGYAICLADVTFNPQHDGLRAGSLTVTGTTATVSEDLSGVGVASDIAIDNGTQSLLGTGLSPAGVIADSNGNVYVSDTTSNSVFKGASSGTSLSAFAIALNAPTGLALDGLGNVFIANSGGNTITEVNSKGVLVATLGSGLSGPQGVAVDGVGNIYVADTGNNRILQLYANGTQNVLPVIGLSAPQQITLDAGGNLYIIDSGNKQIVKYSGGNGQSVVTIDAGVVPSGVAVDPASNVYVTDSAGKQLLVYTAGAAAGIPLLTGLGSPAELAADPDGNLFIADSSKTGAIELRRSLGDIVLPLADVTVSGSQTTTQSIIVNNVGNAALTFSGPPLTTLVGANSGLYSVAPSSSNGCSASVSYNSGADCNFTASFTPTGTGTTSATVYFNSNATNTGVADAVLNGTGKFLITTTTTLNITTPTASPYYYGQNFLLTAGLTPTTLVTSNGSETFTYTVDSQSQAAVPTTKNTLSLAPQAGNHSVSVTYNSDGTYATSSATVNFTVLPAVTTTVLTVAPVNNSGVLTLLFTATVSAPTATGETGTVKFYSGTTLLASQTVGTGGVATYSSSTLSFPNNSFYATYTAASTNGITNFTNSTSATVTPTADFAIGIPTPSVSIAQGGVASASFNVSSVYSGAGTITPNCTGLPANSVCRFQPESLTLGSSTQVENVLIYTNVSTTLASNDPPHGAIALAFGLPLGLGLLLLRRRRVVRLLGVFVLGLTILSGISGCNSNTVNSSNANVTPVGTYAVNVVFTGSAGLTTTHTATISFIVIQDSGPF